MVEGKNESKSQVIKSYDEYLRRYLPEMPVALKKLETEASAIGAELGISTIREMTSQLSVVSNTSKSDGRGD